jgi:hypothetical protein
MTWWFPPIIGWNQKETLKPIAKTIKSIIAMMIGLGYALMESPFATFIYDMRT